MPKKTVVRVSVLVAVIALTCGCGTSPQDKEAKYLKRGQEQMARKEYSRALLEFKNAAQMMPKDPEPTYLSGMVYLETQNITSAVVAFRKAIELNPKHSGAQLRLSELMVASRIKELIEDGATRLQGILANSPDNPEAIDALAFAEFHLGNPEAAARRLEAALLKFPTRLQSSVVLARLKLSRKDFKGAEEALKKAVSSAPHSPQAVFALGQLYLLAGQPENSEEEIKKAVELDPKYADALVGLAALQSAGKRMDEAERTYEQLSALPGRTYRSLHALFIFKMGRTDAALAELEELARNDAGDRTVRSRLVTAYFVVKKLVAAERLLDAALKHNPKDSDALLQRSLLYMKLGKATEAENDLHTMLHFNPDSGEAHLGLAAVYRAKGLKSSEEQELNEALRLSPGLLQARLTLARNLILANRRKHALDLLEKTPDSQKLTAGVIIERNWAWLIEGDLKQVRAALDQVLPISRIPDFVLQDAILKMEQRDYVGARASADEVLSRSPEDVRAASVAADSYAAQKDVMKGLQRLIELANSRPKSAPLHGLLGQWYLRTGKAVEARQAFEVAKVADPKYLNADLVLADLDRQENKLDSARQRLTGVLAADPRNVPALFKLASLDGEAGDQASAIARYRTVLDVDSSNLFALNNVAYLLATDDPNEALKFAQKAVEIAPDHPAVQDTLGWIYYRRGMYSAATSYFKRAASKEPTPRRQFHLAMSYLKSGDVAIGRSMRQAALLRDPDLAKTERGW